MLNSQCRSWTLCDKMCTCVCICKWVCLFACMCAGVMPWILHLCLFAYLDSHACECNDLVSISSPAITALIRDPGIPPDLPQPWTVRVYVLPAILQHIASYGAGRERAYDHWTTLTSVLSLCVCVCVCLLSSLSLSWYWRWTIPSSRFN